MGQNNIFADHLPWCFTPCSLLFVLVAQLCVPSYIHYMTYIHYIRTYVRDVHT